MSPEDKALYNGLLKVLGEATFSLKKRELMAFHKVCLWVENDLLLLLDKKPEAKVKKK